MRIHHALAITAALTVHQPAAAESMRCGQSLVNETTSIAELLQKCGEPQQKSSTTEDVYATNAAGHRYKTGATSTRERWTYDRGPQAFRMVVTIVDGAVKSIERER